jgi:hypothetical protein
MDQSAVGETPGPASGFGLGVHVLRVKGACFIQEEGETVEDRIENVQLRVERLIKSFTTLKNILLK